MCRAKIELTVAFESVDCRGDWKDKGRPWHGTTFKKMATLPIPPSVGLTWWEREWPEDPFQFHAVLLRGNEDGTYDVECECRLLDTCRYGSVADAREAYIEAGWTEEDGAWYPDTAASLPSWAEK